MAVYTAKGAFSWAAWHRPFKFEVSASPSSELTVSLFVRDSDSDASTSSWGGYGNQVTPLGLIRLNPFLISLGRQRVDVQNGTGRVELEISYTQKEASPLETREVWSVRGENSSGDFDLVYIEKKDTGRSYGMKVIDIRTVYDVAAPGSDVDSDINMAPSLSLRSAIQHPFIAPLKFAFRSSEGRLNLLSPLASGGYLFDHLQRERLFDVKARYYAAELVCTLEYLHDKNIILGSWSRRIFSWIPLAMSVSVDGRGVGREATTPKDAVRKLLLENPDYTWHELSKTEVGIRRSLLNIMQ